MHELWYWNYDILESHHGFIQWYVSSDLIKKLELWSVTTFRFGSCYAVLPHFLTPMLSIRKGYSLCLRAVA